MEGQPLNRRLGWALAAAAAVALVLAAAPLPWAERVVLAILAGAMVLWLAEVLPLGITAFAAATALILVGDEPAAETFGSFFDPVVVLMLGGFLLGVALQKSSLDRGLADAALRLVGNDPRLVLLALMAVAATFSMWISNTATAAMVLPVAVALAGDGPPSRGRAYVLGVAAAANIGGIATPIGTPANAIALRFLADHGTPLTFLGWMVRAAPLAAVLVGVAWLILMVVHPLGQGQVPRTGPPGRLSGRQWRLVAVFAATVALWVTTDLHGIDPAIVSALAAVSLFVVQLLDPDDLGKVSWDTLLLIGGSIALGEAVQASGLDDRLASGLAGLGDHGPLIAIAGLAVAAVALTLVSSNTGAAVLLVPLAVLWAGLWGLPVRVLALTAAVAVSFDFLVPMGTPPNAMARATGLVDVKGMMRSGAILTFIGTAALVAAARWLW